MEHHDGLIWIFGAGAGAGDGDGDQVMAFSDEGVEHLGELMRLHRTLMK